MTFPTCAYYLVIVLTQSLKFFSHDHPCVEVSGCVCGGEWVCVWMRVSVCVEVSGCVYGCEWVCIWV